MKNKNAFTLIELLVVVLIIGILSAIALPQYEKAVEKSRAAEALIILRNLHEAGKLYLLENPNASLVPFEDLAIEMPASYISVVDPEDDGGVYCNKYWCFMTSSIDWGWGSGSPDTPIARRCKNGDCDDDNNIYYDLEFVPTGASSGGPIVCTEYQGNYCRSLFATQSGNAIKI